MQSFGIVSFRRGIVLGGVLLGAALTVTPAAAQMRVRQLDFLGQATFPTGYQYRGTEVGGLSGIAYNRQTGQYYTIADDRSSNARFYTMAVDLSGNRLADGRVTFTGVTQLLTPSGQPFAANSLDPEGIALTSRNTLYIASEGDRARNFQPFINEFGLNGQQLNALSVPGKYLVTPTTGIRNNLAFETLTITPDTGALVSATENALLQDGPAAAVGVGSPSRILTYNPATGQPAQEFVYMTDPVAYPSVPTNQFSTNGLVDMLALGNGTYLALERSFSTGVGNTIKLFEVSTQGATDVSGIDDLRAFGPENVTPAEKSLLLDFDTLGITLDNIEGLTFGPDLGNGLRSLIIVSDNNFSTTQFTQVLAFGVAVVPEPGAVSLLLAGIAASGFWLSRRRAR